MRVRRWLVSDFTLEEIKQLDAGSWFDERFKDAHVPTFEEAIREVRGKAGLFPETKSPEVYRKFGYDMERLLLRDLERYGLHQPGADPATPIVIQSFSAESLRKMAFELNCRLPLVLLISSRDRQLINPEWLAEVGKFAAGIGPSKEILRDSR